MANLEKTVVDLSQAPSPPIGHVSIERALEAEPTELAAFIGDKLEAETGRVTDRQAFKALATIESYWTGMHAFSKRQIWEKSIPLIDAVRDRSLEYLLDHPDLAPPDDTRTGFWRISGGRNFCMHVAPFAAARKDALWDRAKARLEQLRQDPDVEVDASFALGYFAEAKE